MMHSRWFLRAIDVTLNEIWHVYLNVVFFVVGILIFEFHIVWIFLRIRIFSIPSLIKQRNSLCNVQCAYTFLIFTISIEKTVCEAMCLYLMHRLHLVCSLDQIFFEATFAPANCTKRDSIVGGVSGSPCDVIPVTTTLALIVLPTERRIPIEWFGEKRRRVNSLVTRESCGRALESLAEKNHGSIHTRSARRWQHDGSFFYIHLLHLRSPYPVSVRRLKVSRDQKRIRRIDTRSLARRRVSVLFGQHCLELVRDGG